jgi:NADH-quinone oxidoreductase subunit L
VLIAAGVGAAMFHLTTHAFFKALLFLAAGSVIHACHHEQDIFKLGGLRKMMPVTFWTFTFGVAAIIGLPFFAGFFSKDAILYLAYEKNPVIFGVLVVTAVLTALYMTRVWRIAFFGEARSDHAAHAHESGAVMTVPLVLLAAGAALGGYAGLLGEAFKGVLSQVPHPHDFALLLVPTVGTAAMLVGAGFALAYYRPGAADRLQAGVPLLFNSLTVAKESFDDVYGYYVAKVQQRFAIILNFLDHVVLSGLIRVGAGVVGFFGLSARALHVGTLHAYVYWFLIGLALLWGFAAGAF